MKDGTKYEMIMMMMMIMIMIIIIIIIMIMMIMMIYPLLQNQQGTKVIAAVVHNEFGADALGDLCSEPTPGEAPTVISRRAKRENDFAAI